MQRIACTLVAVAALGFSGCHRVSSTESQFTESQLIGDWSIPNGEATEDAFIVTNRGFQVTSFKADHSFSSTAHPVGAPPFYTHSGTWPAEGNELVMKFTGNAEMVGQELRLVISDLQSDRPVAANAKNQKQKVVWTRVK